MKSFCVMISSGLIYVNRSQVMFIKLMPETFDALNLGQVYLFPCLTQVVLTTRPQTVIPPLVNTQGGPLCMLSGSYILLNW